MCGKALELELNEYFCVFQDKGNMTLGGEFEIDTGLTDVYQLNQIKTYAGER